MAVDARFRRSYDFPAMVSDGACDERRLRWRVLWGRVIPSFRRIG